MTPFMLAIFVLKFFVPSFCFAFLFRVFGLGYKSKKSLILGLVLYLAYFAVVPTTLILVMGYGRFTHISAVVMLLANFPILLFTTDSIGKTLFLLFTASQVNTVVSVTLNLIRTAFSLSYPVLVLMLCIVSPVLTWLMIKYMAKPMRFMADNIHAELGYLIAIPLVVMVIVYLIPVYPAQNFSNHPFLCTGLMLLVELMFFLFIYTFYSNLKKLTELLQVEHKGKLLQAEISSYQDYLASAKRTRHDARHHNALLLEYLSEGNVASAKEYLEANQQALADSRLTEYCKNAVANAVLRIYRRECETYGITYEVMADIPEKLPLAEPETAALLSNLLENAVTASRPLAPNERSIAVTASVEDGSLKVEIVNRADAPVSFVEGMPQTTRPGGGTGTKSAASIVEKYGGMLRFSQNSTHFTAQFILPLE